MDDITSLDGYEALKKMLVDALVQEHANESSWYFEVEQKIDIAEMAKNNRRSYYSSSKGSMSSRETFEEILSGGVFEFEDMVCEFNNDYIASEDSNWFKSNLNNIINNQLSQNIEQFAEKHNIDLYDVEEFLKSDECLSIKDVFDYDLHENVITYDGNIPAKVSLQIDLVLNNEADTVLALSALNIPVESWLNAVEKEIDNFPDSASFFIDGDDEFDFKVYALNLKAMASKAMKFGLGFSTSDDKSLVFAKDLIQSMVHDWSLVSSRLMLRFNLDDEYINTVSRPVGRHLSSKDREDLVLSVSNAELVPDQEDYCDGLKIRHPFPCYLSEINLAEVDAQDRGVAKIDIDGAVGLRFSTYELFLEEIKEDWPRIYAIEDKSTQGKNHKPLSFSDEFRSKFLNLVKDSDAFQMEKLSSAYPGLKNFIQEFRPVLPSSQDMGQQVIKTLQSKLGLFEGLVKWLKSEQREAVIWMIEHGADLTVRKNDAVNGIGAVHAAAAVGDIGLLKIMHKHGADLTSTFSIFSGEDVDHYINSRSSKKDESSYKINEIGVWDIFSRYFFSKTRKKDLSSDLTWLEDQGCQPNGQFLFKNFGGSYLSGSSLNDFATVDEVICIADDSSLCMSYIQRELCKYKSETEKTSFLAKTLFKAISRGSFELAKICIESGIGTNFPINTISDFSESNNCSILEMIQRDKYQSETVKNVINKVLILESAINAKQAIYDLINKRNLSSALS